MTNSEIKKDELKPCPFCGYSKPSIIIDEYGERISRYQSRLAELRKEKV